ncbi:MAG: PAS domain S-box protein [Gallionella sp.]|nr:PAS domain S-box protein [Gallionella sp.]
MVATEVFMNADQLLPHDISHRLRLLDVLDRITQISLASENMDDVMRGVLDLMLEVFNADRAWFLYPCDPDALSWGVPMERVRPEWPGLFAQGVDIPMDSAISGVFSEFLRANGTVQYCFETGYPTSSPVVRHFSVKSQLAIALRPKIGKAWVFGLHHCASEVRHDEKDLHLFSAVARRITDSLSSLISIRQQRESEAKYRLLIEGLQEGIWMIDKKACTSFVNQRMAQMLGYNVEEMQGRHLFSFMDERGKEIATQNLERRKQGISEQHDFELLRKDGSRIYTSMATSPILDEAGNYAGALAGVMDITERRQIEEELRLKAQLLDAASDTIFMVDFDGNFVYLNEAAWKTRGYTQDEMMGINLHVLDTPKYESLIESRMRDLMENGQRIFESEHRRKDGSVMPIEVSARLIESGGRKLVLSVIRDITERKQAEEALKESEEKYRSIYENTQVGLYRTRVSDGKLMMANDAMAKMFGFDSVEEATAKYITSEHYVDPGTRERLLDIFQQYGKFDNFEARLTRNDGVVRWFQYSGRLVQDKGYIEGVAADITERRQAEDMLAESEQHFRTVAESANDAIITISDADNIVDWNHAAERLFGRTHAEMSGLPLTVLMPERFRKMHREGLARVVAGGASHVIGKTVELAGLRKDGSEFPLELSLAQWHIGPSQFFTAIIRDLAERKQLEEQLTAQYQHLKDANKSLVESNQHLKLAQNQLLQSEKMASIGLLAAGVAHEINNPIGYVNSNMGTLEKYLTDIFAVLDRYESAEMLLDKDNPQYEVLRRLKEEINLGYLREDIKALIAESHQGLERVKKIVLDLKNFSHADSEDQWMLADIHRELDTTLNVVWNELKYNCEVVKEYGSLPEIYCLPSQLNQVFMNLLVNAAQAIEVRGTITLRTGQEGDRVWAEVSDTGNGIPPEDFPHLFDPFFTTKPVGKGTGLGLSVSYSIVERHHGKIEVHSEVGKGSTFRVWLPVQQPDIREEA